MHLFGAFFALLPFSCENEDPSFLHTLTSCWLDFHGLGRPRMQKTSKTRLLEKHRFLGFIKHVQNQFFLILMCFLAQFWSSRATHNHRINFQFMCLCPECHQGRFLTTFCSICVSFRGHCFVLFSSFCCNVSESCFHV